MPLINFTSRSKSIRLGLMVQVGGAPEPAEKEPERDCAPRVAVADHLWPALALAGKAMRYQT